jgi:hypothetical protein
MKHSIAPKVEDLDSVSAIAFAEPIASSPTIATYQQSSETDVQSYENRECLLSSGAAGQKLNREKQAAGDAKKRIVGYKISNCTATDSQSNPSRGHLLKDGPGRF